MIKQPGLLDRRLPPRFASNICGRTRVADAAGIQEGSRIGTRSFRRAFANRLRDVPLRELTWVAGRRSRR